MSYHVNLIKFGGEPYCGIVKCWNYKQTSVRVYMPLPSWFSLVSDVLLNLKYPVQQQLGMIEEEPMLSNETYVSINRISRTDFILNRAGLRILFKSTFLLTC